MRLLVTRPMPDAEETARQLEEMGHTVIAEPVTNIELLPPPNLTFQPSAIVFTSRNAVRAVTDWPAVSDLLRTTVFAVGEATAEVAREAGFSAVSAGAGDGRALGDELCETLDPLAGKVLYVAGRDRAGDLEARLSSTGFAVVTVEAYAAASVAKLGDKSRDALASRTLDGALFFSRRSAALFADLVTRAGLADGLRHVVIYAISSAAAEPLRQFNPANMRIAAHPDAESLLAVIGR